MIVASLQQCPTCGLRKQECIIASEDKNVVTAASENESSLPGAAAEDECSCPTSASGYAVLVEKVGLFLEKVGLFWKKPYFFQIVKF